MQKSNTPPNFKSFETNVQKLWRFKISPSFKYSAVYNFFFKALNLNCNDFLKSYDNDIYTLQISN